MIRASAKLSWQVHRCTRVKVCGITLPEHGRDAALAGADAIGLVFYPPSPRAVDLELAGLIAGTVPPFVTIVGLFVNAQASYVSRVLNAVPLDVLQFHGDEPPQDCERHGRPYIKAVPMQRGIDLHAWARRYRSAKGLLLDTHRAGKRGGTGETFDWSLVPAAVDVPIILAGGLTVDNVTDAVTKVRPYAVDVSGGVESAEGIKDKTRMASFIARVRSVGD
jgi:phosphoribosylanthranilate isomerase